MCVYCLHEFMCTTCVQAMACRGQRASNFFELVLQVVVSHLMLVLGIDPGSFVRAVSTLNC